jgi:hypothetical protein
MKPVGEGAYLSLTEKGCIDRLKIAWSALAEVARGYIIIEQMIIIKWGVK